MTSVKYVLVSDEEYGEAVELPLEDNGTLLLSTLTAQFPGASGLKFRTENNVVRGVRLADGRFHVPDNEWGKTPYYCVFPKVENKRKIDDNVENPTAKTKRLETKLKCSDLVVLNIPYMYDEQKLKEYFGQFGELLMLQIKRDKNGQSRGYGFLRYTNLESQVRVLSQRHKIDGRNCEVKVPKSKEGNSSELSGKVFVGRVTEDLSADDIREYFTKFGEVINVFVPKNPFRGFAFVTFLDPEVASSLCGEDHIVKDVSVRVSEAAPKPQIPKNRHQTPPPSEPWERSNNRHNDNYRNWYHSQHDNRGNVDMPNLQSLGINGQDSYNPMMPLSPAIVAAALTQAAGWSLANGRMMPPPPPPSGNNQWSQRNNYNNRKRANNDYNSSGNR